MSARATDASPSRVRAEQRRQAEQRRRALPRLAFTATEAPAVLGVSEDFFREHIAGQLRWVRRGSKKLVSVRELEAWLEREARATIEEDR